MELHVACAVYTCHPEDILMSDDTKNRGPADRARVNVHESWELSYWSEKFGVLLRS